MSRTEYVRPVTTTTASQPSALDAARLLLADRYVGLALTALSALLALWSVYRMGVWVVFHLRRLAEAWVGKKEKQEEEEEEQEDAHTVRHPDSVRHRRH